MKTKVLINYSIFYIALLVIGLLPLHADDAHDAAKKTHASGMEMEEPNHDMVSKDTDVMSQMQGTMHTESDTSDSGHGDHAKMVMAAEKEDPDLANQVKIEEQLGNYIDLNAVFKDETGKQIKLEQLFDKPVVILPVYFMCTTICNFLQANLANVLNFVDQVPGVDFNVIYMSFADDEDHTHAFTSKRNYQNLVHREFPMENWFYLTGDEENIRKVTNSLGYYFIKKKDHFYIHPSSLMVLAKDGKITRYLYGPDFLPFDLGMALSEAEKGETGISIKRGVLSFCFDYDPTNKKYVFKVFRITGTSILVLLTGFIIFLVFPSKNRNKPRYRDKDSKDKTVS